MPGTVGPSLEGPLLSDNLAPRLVAYVRADRFVVPPRKRSDAARRQQLRMYVTSAYSSEAEWSGSRPLNGPSKVRFLRWSSFVRSKRPYTHPMLVRIQRGPPSRKAGPLAKRQGTRFVHEHIATASSRFVLPDGGHSDEQLFSPARAGALASHSATLQRTRPACTASTLPAKLEWSSARLVFGRIRFDSGRGLPLSRRSLRACVARSALASLTALAPYDTKMCARGLREPRPSPTLNALAARRRRHTARWLLVERPFLQARRDAIDREAPSVRRLLRLSTSAEEDSSPAELDWPSARLVSGRIRFDSGRGLRCNLPRRSGVRSLERIAFPPSPRVVAARRAPPGRPRGVRTLPPEPPLEALRLSSPARRCPTRNRGHVGSNPTRRTRCSSPWTDDSSSHRTSRGDSRTGKGTPHKRMGIPKACSLG